MTNKRRRQIKLACSGILIGMVVGSLAPAFAQSSSSTNSFFGNTMPGTTGPNPSADDPPGMNAPNKLPSAGGDYTDDEKRMQKKYKARMAHDRGLIARGERMMKGSPESKEYKKGKVMKEIGERDLAELKANSPFPDAPEKKKKGDKENK